MSAPLTGPSQELGTEMKKGITLAFDAQNAAGGIRGRKIELEFRDDQYQPASAETAARDLLDVVSPAAPARCPSTTSAVVAGDAPVANGALTRGPNAVLALVGSVGTPTMVRSAPIAVETGSLFFGAFTGAAKVLRDDVSGACRKYIFNVRASYAQEARATVEYFKKQRVPDSRHMISFDQNDSFGQAGFDGLVAAVAAIDGVPATAAIPRFRYTRDDQASVPAQVRATSEYLAKLLAEPGNHAVGILMTDTYGPATTYIKGVRDWQYADDAEQEQTQKATRLTLLFSNVSFVGPNSLAQRLKDAGSVRTQSGAKPYTTGVFVSQVVPNYESDDSDGVRDYLRALSAIDQPPSFTSLEGYLAGRVFVAGLVAHVGAFTPDGLVATFEKLPFLNLGLGATSGFSPGRHDYSKSVFGTAIDANGGFSNSYFWSEGSAIQLFE
ncbi:MAG: putative leucine/isoleucine/valine-binding protein precursor [Labilithrix sp.]|nr:putative leucine/isoleucine/valine-binding protein precursor [Labilithrix sp.]